MSIKNINSIQSNGYIFKNIKKYVIILIILVGVIVIDYNQVCNQILTKPKDDCSKKKGLNNYVLQLRYCNISFMNTTLEL